MHHSRLNTAQGVLGKKRCVYEMLFPDLEVHKHGVAL